MSFLRCLSSLSISPEGWVLKLGLSPDINPCPFLTCLCFVPWAIVFSLIIFFRFRGRQDPCLEWREWYKSSCVGWQTHRPHYLFAVQPQVHDLCQRMFQHGLLVAHHWWLTLMLSCFCTARVASRKKLRRDWDNGEIGSFDWAGEHPSTWPSHGCAVHLLKRKKNYFAELLQKDFWCGRFNRDSNFPAVTAPSSSRGMTRFRIRV